MFFYNNFVHDNATHANQAFVLNGAAMQNHSVTDGDIIPYDEGRAFGVILRAMVNMQDAEVLNVGVLSNTDMINITAYHRTWPDGTIFGDGDLPNNGGTRVHINPFGDVWAMLLELLNVI